MGTTEKEPLSPLGWDIINDLSVLPDNENIIIEYLLRRMECEQIYTWVGPVLLALNPGKSVFSDQYDSNKYDEYKNFSKSAQKDISPHICAIAARAHYRLVQGLGKSCQVIVISGESGTGKTFNANKALNFLAAINETSSAASQTCVRDIVRKIRSACPLISAFSTATTERNVRSSRHGQLVRLEYDNERVCGATIHSFLLERSRVTMTSNNFHIFSQLLAGLSDYELNGLRLRKDGNYRIIGDQSEMEISDLRQNFVETVNAMDDLGFSTDERNDIFQVIALLVHMGNVKFKERFCGGCVIDTSDEDSEEALRNVSALTNLSATEVTELFTTARISTNNGKRPCSVSSCELGTVDMCRNRLHSIIRHIYYQLFQQLIDRVNKSLSSGVRRNSWLGILDIFGFEIFAENGIEQLCINYANERLQLYFMENYLDSGRCELTEEGFNNFPEPKEMHVCKNRLAVIETTLFPALSDATQCSAQFNVPILRHRLVDKTTVKFLTMPSENQTFVIQHYSSPVEYSFQNFLSKNTDKVPPELPAIFAASSNMFLRSLKDAVNDDMTNSNGKIYAKKGTTLAKVKQNLDTLIRELNKCDSHYVRCVKPSRVNGLWMKDELKKQLACTGVFDALPLARCMYPIRMTYQEFLDRYSMKRIDLKDSIQICKTITQQILNSKTLSETIHFGNRLIFLSETAFFELERFRKEYRSSNAKKIQIFWKSKYKNIIANRMNNVLLKSCNTRKGIHSEYLNNNHIKNHAEVENLFQPKYKKDVQNLLENVSPSKITNRNVFAKQYPKTSTIRKMFEKFYDSDNVETLNKFNQKNDGTQPSPHICNKIDGSSKIIMFPNKNNYDSSETSIISYNGSTFYRRGRILSRRKLADVPVRFHTRLTCLRDSHQLPRSELPRGLQDCL